MVNAHDLALATIGNLNDRRCAGQRSHHKYRMIRIAECAAAGIPSGYSDDMAVITEAAEYCQSCGA